MKLSDEIKYELMRFVRSTQSDIIIPNFYINTNYEMDLFRMTKAGIVYEYEIKISKSDYLNDFKKGQKTCGGWVLINGIKEIREEKILLKHDDIKNGKRLCNHFYFVVPENLIQVEEIPEYCGLIYYCKKNYPKFKIVKSSKRLHKNKYTNYAELTEKLTYRCNGLQGKLRYTEYYLNDALKYNNRYRELLNDNNIEIPFIE